MGRCRRCKKKVRYFRFCFWLVNVFSFLVRHAAVYRTVVVVLMVVVREVVDLGREGVRKEGKESSFRTFSTCVSGYMLPLLNPPFGFLGM